MGTAKLRKSQPPPLFPTQHREADLGHDIDELMLMDVMTVLGSINCMLAAHNIRLDEMSAQEVPLPATDEQVPGTSCATVETRDTFDGMEEAVRCKVADRLRRTMPAYVVNTDDNSVDEEMTSPQPKKHHKAVSGKLRTADNTVVKQITWPRELIYTPAGLPAVYEYLSPMLFVNGYLEVLATVNEDT